MVQYGKDVDSLTRDVWENDNMGKKKENIA
jgi:hypothetical protein